MMEEIKPKLYSLKAISLATAIGGPLAAGITLRRNFINLGKEKAGITALLTCIIIEILLFTALFTLPDSIVDKIPGFLLPFLYTIIIYIVANRQFGEEIEEYIRSKTPLYSDGKAALTGIFSGLLLVGVIMGYVFTSTPNWNVDQYNMHLESYTKSETEALQLFIMIDDASNAEIESFIVEKGIPGWKDCIEHLTLGSQVEDLPDELVKYNQLIIAYCRARIVNYEAIARKTHDTDFAYDEEVFKTVDKVNEASKNIEQHYITIKQYFE